MVTYREAGVDLEAAERLVERVRELARSTARPGVLSEIGGFGGLWALRGYRDPVLVASADGVGTKLLVAVLLGKHDTVGVDLVAMCANDVLAQGAEPLFLLDYLGMGRLDLEVAGQVLEGLRRGCLEAGCALLGGETAEMPSFYPQGAYELVGFCVGVVERDQLVDGSGVSAGDLLVGLGSDGLHSNGYSLARKVIFERLGMAPQDPWEGGESIGLELLRPSRIYVRPVLSLMRHLRPKAIAHITGGGIPGNLRRVLPRGCGAALRWGSWPVPAIFHFLRRRGEIPPEEMLRTFNCGLGMILVVSPSRAEEAVRRLVDMGERAWIVGEVTRTDRVEVVGLCW